MKLQLLVVVSLCLWLWLCCAELEGTLQVSCPVEDTYCKCSPPDGGFIDISKILVYPAFIQHTLADFSYTPCSPHQCASLANNAAMCMHNTTTRKEFGIGNFTLGEGWMIHSYDPLNFTITYNGGDPIESVIPYSTVNFVHKSSAVFFKFIGSEESFNQINFKFEVSGSLIVFVNSSDNSTSNSHGLGPGQIAGIVFGSWVFMVALTAVVVSVIVYSAVKWDRKKRSYQQLAIH